MCTLRYAVHAFFLHSSSNWIINVSQLPKGTHTSTVFAVFQICRGLFPYDVVRMPFSSTAEGCVKTVFDITRLLSIAESDSVAHGQRAVLTANPAAFNASILGFKTPIPNIKSQMPPTNPHALDMHAVEEQTRRIIILAEDFDAADVTLQARLVELLVKMANEAYSVILIATVGRIALGTPSRQVRSQFLGSTVLSHPINPTSPAPDKYLYTDMQIRTLQDEMEHVFVDLDIIGYIRDILRNESRDKRTTMGFPARAAQLVMRAGVAVAVLRSRGHVVPRDVEEVAFHVLLPRVQHKTWLDLMPKTAGTVPPFGIGGQGASALVERVIRDAIDDAPVPL